MQFLVQVNHIETASLYFGCRLDSQTLEKDEEVHNVCYHLSGENRPCNISVGKPVGVYLPVKRRWVRGRVVEIISNGKDNKCEYKVFLTDKGYYRSVKSKAHIIRLDDVLTYNPEFLVMALDEVVPNTTLSQEVKQCLQDIFMEGKIIFSPKNSDDEAAFGDIFIKPIENTEHTSYEQNRSNKINLKAELLKKGFVKESQSYIEDVSKLLPPIKELSNICEYRKMTPPVTKHFFLPAENENRRARRREDSRNYPSNKSPKDTGYSSSSSYEKPIFVADLKSFNPVKGSRKSRSEEFVPRNHYSETYRRTGSTTRPERQTDLKATSRSCTRVAEDHKELSPFVNRPVKRVSWGGTKVYYVSVHH